MSRNEILDTVLNVINETKKTGFSADSIELDFYLGGDLGIDSVEMLGIWYDLEKTLNIKIEDGEKRDLYTVEDVVLVLESKMKLSGTA